LITVLILDNKEHSFQPLLKKNEPISFLPVSINFNLLSIFYSWINSYFSKDKIYVVCINGEENEVLESCKGINEENIIIEPKRINYSISLFYATLIISKIYQDEVVFFFPVNFMFPQDFKMGNWLFSSGEIANKDWIVIPSVLIDKDEKVNDFIEAGKSLTNIKGSDFFVVDSVSFAKDEFKKRKIFGKQGKFPGIVCGRQKSILNSFIKDEKQLFLKNMYNFFKINSINWEQITTEYENLTNDVITYNYFAKNKNFLTIFLDTKPDYLDNWKSYIDRFSSKKDGNVVSGNVTINDIKNVICFNYDEEEINLDSLQNSVVVKKNGFVAIKSLNINKEVCDAVSKKEKKSKNC